LALSAVLLSGGHSARPGVVRKGSTSGGFPPHWCFVVVSRAPINSAEYVANRYQKNNQQRPVAGCASDEWFFFSQTNAQFSVLDQTFVADTPHQSFQDDATDARDK